jgi:hypothetical protein
MKEVKMNHRNGMSGRTRMNWLIDAGVFLTGLFAGTTGMYFLFFSSGGYQGGRNATYGVTLLFARSTWDDLHTWGGVLMIAAAVAHFLYHWPWVLMMIKRMGSVVGGQRTHMSTGAKVNLFVDGVIVLSFFLTAASGVYFLFAPQGGYQGGANAGWDPGFLLTRIQWDSLHTWAAVTFAVAAALHFIIHWRWVEKVTKRFFLSLASVKPRERVPVEM